MSRATRWCFTINNPEKDDFIAALPAGVRYIIWQKERGADGTGHLQGYIAFANARAMSGVKKIVGDRAHVEVCKGDEPSNIAYCSKVETRVGGPWEFGVRAAPGKRTDLAEAAEAIRRTGDLEEVDDVLRIKYGKGLAMLAASIPPPKRPVVDVYLLVGFSGIGKTYRVLEAFPDAKKVHYGNSGVWFDGYISQDTIIFDEFEGQCQLTRMLEYLDHYPLTLETKGGTVAARYKRVFITSNRLPQDWYPNKFGPGGAIAIRDADGKYDIPRLPQQFVALLRRLGVDVNTGIPGPHWIEARTRPELFDKWVAAGLPLLEGELADSDMSPRPLIVPVPMPIIPRLALPLTQDESAGEEIHSPLLKRSNATVASPIIIDD